MLSKLAPGCLEVLAHRRDQRMIGFQDGLALGHELLIQVAVKSIEKTPCPVVTTSQPSLGIERVWALLAAITKLSCIDRLEDCDGSSEALRIEIGMREELLNPDSIDVPRTVELHVRDIHILIDGDCIIETASTLVGAAESGKCCESIVVYSIARMMLALENVGEEINSDVRQTDSYVG